MSTLVIFGSKTRLGRKDAGPHDIPAESFIIRNDDNFKTLIALFNKIYDTGIILEKWLLHLHLLHCLRYPTTRLFNDLHILSLMCHVLKNFSKSFMSICTRNAKRIVEKHSMDYKMQFKISFNDAKR